MQQRNRVTRVIMRTVIARVWPNYLRAQYKEATWFKSVSLVFNLDCDHVTFLLLARHILNITIVTSCLLLLLELILGVFCRTVIFLQVLIRIITSGGFNQTSLYQTVN